MSDQLHTGMRIRILVVFDRYTRELRALRVVRSFTGADDVKVLNELTLERSGPPMCLRTDDGSEFTGADLSRGREHRDVESLLSRRGKPVDNAICESTSGRIRDKFLNQTVFASVPHAAEVAAEFRVQYDRQRPTRLPRASPWLPSRVITGIPLSSAFWNRAPPPMWSRWRRHQWSTSDNASAKRQTART